MRSVLYPGINGRHKHIETQINTAQADGIIQLEKYWFDDKLTMLFSLLLTVVLSS